MNDENPGEKSYSDTSEVLEQVEDIYRDFADWADIYDFEIDYNIDFGFVSFSYNEEGMDKEFNVGDLDGSLMIEGAAFRQTPRGDEIAPIRLQAPIDSLEGYLKEIYSALEDPDNWHQTMSRGPQIR